MKLGRIFLIGTALFMGASLALPEDASARPWNRGGWYGSRSYGWNGGYRGYRPYRAYRYGHSYSPRSYYYGYRPYYYGTPYRSYSYYYSPGIYY